MRAFRPSSFGDRDERNEDAHGDRLTRLQRYAALAEAGQPLFKEDEQAELDFIAESRELAVRM